ncbi:hypothetical protein CEXT_467971 [Caerostris extrusa]|uniref:C2H2-type domain-containing protein n=1 Tax=Caerostris extrusa TaxID=172846 RepID=A0AAV4N1R4_CAEEX|nr:hypothetical protein CEXT_467971 [Caerostris extrusa]
MSQCKLHLNFNSNFDAEWKKIQYLKKYQCLLCGHHSLNYRKMPFSCLFLCGKAFSLEEKLACTIEHHSDALFVPRVTLTTKT